MEGIAALVTVDPDGVVGVKETGDRLGRKRLALDGGVGLVVGLFALPLLAARVVGAVASAADLRSLVVLKVSTSLSIRRVDTSSRPLVATTLANAASARRRRSSRGCRASR